MDETRNVLLNQNDLSDFVLNETEPTNSLHLQNLQLNELRSPPAD